MKSLIAALCLLAAAGAGAQGFDHEHKAWNALLKEHVVLIDGGKASQVRYAGLARNRTALKSYLDSLSRVSGPEFRNWSKDRQLAFLINAYNAHMIEHDTIRAKGTYGDPRIHMAVNCAAIGCPMLREEAYAAARLDRQLEEQVVRLLSDRSRNRYKAAGNALEVSEVFKWYSVDFTSGLKGINSREQFFARYAAMLTEHPDRQNIIRDQKAGLRFLDYDWRLNDAKR